MLISQVIAAGGLFGTFFFLIYGRPKEGTFCFVVAAIHYDPRYRWQAGDFQSEGKVEGGLSNLNGLQRRRAGLVTETESLVKV